MMYETAQFNYKNHWQEIEINLERSSNDDQPLGLTMAGGIDTPFYGHRFPHIIIINIAENGLAYTDKQLKLYDIILRVNNSDFTNIKHHAALNILKSSGHKVQLLIRRLSPLITEEIEMEQRGKLGITITGGIGNEYYQNDPGIFITRKNQYQSHEGFEIGDRLLYISSPYNTYDLRFVTYVDAKKSIQAACAESRKIKLSVGHAQPITQTQNKSSTFQQDQHSPHKSNNEGKGSAAENRDNKTEYYNQTYETIDAVLNEPNEENLIIKFNYDDYLRYENHGRPFNNPLSQNRSTKSTQAHDKRFTTAPIVLDHEENINVQRNVIVNNSHQNPVNDERTAQEVKSREATINAAKAERLRRQEGRIGQRARMDRDGAAEGLRWQVD